MKETSAEILGLQQLLDRSAAQSGEHLRGIVSADRRLSAAQLVTALVGMKVLVLATVTAAGEPRTSCVDGHFLHARWVFSTSGSAYKAQHLAVRPATSATYVDGERIAVFVHGAVERIGTDHPDFGSYDAHFTKHYHSSPTTWGPGITFFRIEPTYMIGYAMEAASFPSIG